MRRRDFLKRAGALALAVPTLSALKGCDTAPQAPALPSYHYDGPLGPEDLFSHGVASGDPLSDRVILWTRLTVAAPAPDVFWEVAPTPDFQRILAAGWTTAPAERDHCVKVDALLPPKTTQPLYYRFKALGRTSPTGRTRLAASGPTAHCAFAVCSCSNFAAGYFHGYREIAQRDDLDAVIHLGDYIYEYGTPRDLPDRAPEPPHEAITLADYRTRYAQYRRDPDLQAAHAAHPWVVVWDDHESANNSARDGAENHHSDEGVWADRKAAAVQAWHEWLPVREAPDRHIYRRLVFGDLVDLIMLDTRLWGRDPQAPAVNSPLIHDANRQLLGADQEAWLAEQLQAARARWTVLGQQVMLGQLAVGGTPFNTDQWDGYAPARQRLYDAVAAAQLENLVVLTGDIHSAWAIELHADGAPDVPLGLELVVPGITSAGLRAAADLIPLILDELPHVRWVDLERRGYLLLDLDHEQLHAAWRLFDRVDQPHTASTPGATFTASTGHPRLTPS